MYRSIETGMWDDPWFAELPPNAKLLFIYLITNRRATACGAFEIQRRALVFETGLSGDAVKEAIEALTDKVTWWSDHQIMWVHNFYRRQRANTGPSFTVSAIKALTTFPDEVRIAVETAYPELAQPGNYPIPPSPNGVSTHPTPTPHPSDTHPTPTGHRLTVTGTEEVTGDREGTPAARRAKRATQIPQPFDLTEEMYEWAEGEHIPRDALERESLKFVNYYLGTGKPMKDWSATWENWQLRAQENKAQGQWTGRQR